MFPKPLLRMIVLAALIAAPGLPAATGAATLDEIIARHVESRGGLEALEAVATARLTGTVSSGGVSNPITIEYKRPGKIRIEVESQGVTAVQAFDGEVGWAVFPAVGIRLPTELTGEPLRQLQDRADVIEGPLVGYAEKGHALELLGEEDVDGRPAYKLRLKRRSGSEMTVYLDAETCLEVKQVTESTVKGATLAVTVFLEDYEQVGGLTRAQKVRAVSKGGFLNQELDVEKTELNVDIDDARFVPPSLADQDMPILGDDEYVEGGDGSGGTPP